MLTLKVKVGARAGSGNFVVVLKGSTSFRYCTLHVNDDISPAIPGGSGPLSRLGRQEVGGGRTATVAVIVEAPQESHQEKNRAERAAVDRWTAFRSPKANQSTKSCGVHWTKVNMMCVDCMVKWMFSENRQIR